MAFKLPKDTNPFLVGALAAAILVPWVGFDALGWKTGAAAESLVKRGAETAVIGAYGHICAEQFKAAKDAPARLEALAKVEKYSRGDAITKTGYATMLGAKEPVQGVAQACAEQLVPEKG